MRRTSWFRPIAVLLAVWLPLIIGEPGVVHACPTHGAPVVAAASVPHAIGSMAEHHHPSAEPRSSRDSAPGHDHHNCTCISCCVGSVAAPATKVAVTTVVVALYEIRLLQPTVQALPSLAPEFSRPYPTGPPRA
jgi:hypothetical protein